jgi:transglutaminase-like putative cysteine protease
MHPFRSESYRRATAFTKTVTVAVTAALLSMILRPPAASAQVAPAGPSLPLPAASPPREEASERYARALRQLEADVKAARGSPGAGETGQGLEAVRDGIRNLKALRQEVSQSFAATSALLDERKLAGEIRERHASAQAVFERNHRAMEAVFERFEAADADDYGALRSRSLRELQRFLSAHRPDRPERKLDPRRLPWRVLESKARKPAATERTFRAGVPSAMLASVAPFATPLGTQAPASPSSPEYLGESDAVQLTQPIRDLAASLGGNPVRIFDWVRDHVAYVPSFGSLQGSDVTLSKRSGNAFDTSSLLIALCRASGIPARYVHGVVDLPADAAMNWVGGTTTAQAAQQVLGQGGVPNVALASAGRITHIRIEHVWVEAWVDFAPSRGQVNVAGAGDTWVPLDASYKQSAEAAGLASQLVSSLDPVAVRSAFAAGAVVNEAEGWVQGGDPGVVQQAFLTSLHELNTYVAAQKPGATNADVFGFRTIVAEHSEALAAALPYQTVAIRARYADVPAALTHRFRYTIYGSELDRALDAPLLTFEDTLPRLAGRRVTLSYAPASQSDVNVIAGALPKPHADGSPATPEELAAIRLPAYLIQLRPELRVDGVVRASGAPVTMGTAMPAMGAFTSLDFASGWDPTDDLLTAGQATAIGLDVQGIGTEQLSRLTARMAETKARIEGGDLGGLTGEMVGGDIVTLAAWSYFASVDHGGRAAHVRARMIDVPALSYGLAHVDLDVATLFGIAMSAHPSGIVLDIGHLRHIRWSKDGDGQAWVQYNRLMGQYASAMEHSVPEQLFVSAQTPGEAVSAVKLLGKAAAAGQRIYTVTAANLSVALPRLALSAATLDAIRAAVAAGKEVTVHERSLAVNGWTGAGYIVIDPATGAGAYMISGGANGGKLLAAIAGLLTGFVAGVYMGALIGAVLTGGATLGAFLAVALVIAIIFFTINLIIALTSDQETYKCYAGGALTGFGLGMLFTGPELSKLLAAIAILLGWQVPSNALPECV